MLNLNPDKTRSRRLIGRVHRTRLRTIALLPSMITLANGIFGFTAIGLIAKGPQYYGMAAYLVFYAMIADALDGRVARMSKATSSFGGQLDSLCDALSFGAAPAFLMLNLMLSHHRTIVGDAELFLGDLFERFVWVVAIAYLSCALIRLARFNVENEEDESAHMSFIGLPSPAAAGVVASLVMFYHHVLTDEAAVTTFFKILQSGVLYSLPFITLGCGLLMVSRIRYSHLFNQIFRGKKPMTYLYTAGLVFGLLYICRLQLALVISFGGFALSGFVRWFYRKIMVPKLLHRKLTSEQPQKSSSKP
ncbi:MAG: phosphatidylcholine/phosphatidylserine synthase [Planctomycetes bacterium]|nr:phosphatidylcholine/phosphatidylserine synthase [Planctomycetota bacterium]